MADCRLDFEAVEERIDRVLTQYRESPKLLALMRTYLRQVEIVEQSICDLPFYFSLDNAVGDQLSLIGKRLGFPRTQCVCEVQPVFGFDCATATPLFDLQILGFCTDASWLDCTDVGVSEISVNEDGLYRKLLQVRVLQHLALFDLANLKAAVKILWGPTARVIDRGRGRVVVAPGRALTPSEETVVQLYPRVLPVGLGIRVRFHFGPTTVFGFGDGWGGFCDGEGVDGQPLLTVDDEEILTVDDEPLLTGNLGIGSDWMCEIDVRPYEC